MVAKISVLVVTRDEASLGWARERLDGAAETEFDLERAATAAEGVARLIENRHDACLLDERLDDRTGIEVFDEAKKKGSDVPVLLVAATYDRALDLAAMDHGVAEFLVRDDTSARLLERAIRYSVAHQVYPRALARRNEELAKIDAQKNELLGMAAHDLRNPLGIVYGYTQLLADDFESMPAAEVREILGIISRTSKFMMGMIGDLLDLTAIEAGTLRVELAPTDPVEIARGNVALHRLLAASKSIELQLEHDPDVPLVMLDADRFGEVLDNLMSNAVKYSSPGTTVTVAVRRGEGAVVFEVRDQGRGIAPEFQESLFEPFAKEEATGTAGEKSAGLGLAIVRRIVDAHGGSISVASAPGEGSTFRVTVPVEGPAG